MQEMLIFFKIYLFIFCVDGAAAVVAHGSVQ